nr:MAG TPA: hypothetical protein [Caudoviricetes sp.]
MKAKNKVLLDRYETSRPPFEPPTTNAHTV